MPAAITAVMTGEAYAQSARDRARSRRPVRRLREEPRAVPARDAEAPRRGRRDQRRSTCRPISMPARKQAWDEAVELGEDFGYRNAQATVLAPTGTIGFMMDCDTTGVEPDIALVKYKKLVGGGLMKIVNGTVPMALEQARLHQARDRGDRPLHRRARDDRGGAVPEGRAPAGVRLRVQAGQGERSIHYMGHIRMMGATQPFISGAISKTVNVPREATRRGDREGLHRVVAARRQGDLDLPRRQQADAAAQHVEGRRGRHAQRGRQRRPRRARGREGGRQDRRAADSGASCPTSATSITHKFDIAGHEGYITVGLFEDGTPGEIFLVMAKEGSTISGFADAFAQAISYALQYGVPLQVLVDKFSHARFEPSGMTKNPEVRFAKSIVDYIFRWMATKFLSPEAQFRAGVNMREEPAG